MKILMIAPEPCFQPRGTPFSVYHRTAALLRLGHTVDLVTYHLGNDADMEGLRMFRIARVPGVHKVKVGPSGLKFVLDILVFLRAVGLLLTRRYDVIHTHEEAGLMGALLRGLTRTRHLYDMHSDLAQQLLNFRFTRNRFLLRLMDTVQRVIVRQSDAVIVICPDLVRRVREIAPDKPCVLIENTSMLESYHESTPAEVAALRQELGIDGRRVFLYTGTMESYQGMDLLVESLPAVVARHPDVAVLAVGGQPEQIAALRALAERLGVGEHLVCPGVRPPEEMWTFMQLADVLVSPRLLGTNTPLKLYSYLRAGRPILATNLLTHTQVLNDETALLVEPRAEAWAAGALRLLEEEGLAARLAANGLRLAEEKYTYEAYLQKTALAYTRLAQG